MQELTNHHRIKQEALCKRPHITEVIDPGVPLGD